MSYSGFVAIHQLQHFIGSSQRHAVICAMRGEERKWFAGRLAELAHIVETMPATYEQRGNGDATVAYLHYFAGGCGSWWITEKDAGSPDYQEPGMQIQAFGLADPFGDGGEIGYISIAEILEHGGELDFHFQPQTLGELRGEAVCDE